MRGVLRLLSVCAMLAAGIAVCAADEFIIKPPTAGVALPALNLPAAQRGAVRQVAFSPDGRLLVTTGVNDTAIVLWDLTTGQCLGLLAGHKRPVNAFAFTPDGSKLASAGDDGFIILWDVAGRRALNKLVKHDGAVLSLAFNPRGDKLVSGGADATVVLWDVAAGRVEQTFTEHHLPVYAVAFSPLGTLLASGANDRTVILRDLNGEFPQKILPDQPADVAALAFTPDGQSLAVATGVFNEAVKRFTNAGTALWDVTTARTLRTLTEHDGVLEGLAFSPDGKTLAASYHDQTTLLWETATGNAQEPRIGQMLSPDAARSATWTDDGAVTIRDAEGKPLLTLLSFYQGTAWLCGIPQGYYACSRGADAIAGWQFGDTRYPCDSFAAIFARPERVQQALAGDLPDDAPVLTAKTLPPNIGFVSPRQDAEVHDQVIDVEIQAAGLRPITRVEFTVNGQPAPTEIARALTVDKPTEPQYAFHLKLPLPFSEMRMILRAIAYDSDNLKSSPAEVTLYRPGGKPLAAKLILLAVGINTYQGADIPRLTYAASDARALAEFIAKRMERSFSAVSSIALTNEQATLTNVRAALRTVKAQAAKDDIVIVFLDGHRMLDKGIAYFAPYDIDMTDLAQTALSWRELTGLLAESAADRVLVLADTAQPAMGVPAAGKPLLFYAAKPNEIARGRGDWGHSAFVKAVMEGLSGEADGGERDGSVTLGELNDFVAKRVEELTEKRQHPVLVGAGAAALTTMLAWMQHLDLTAMTARELTEMLLVEDGLLKRRDHARRTMLHWAVAANRPDLVELLLLRGAEVNAADGAGMTPLHLATAAGNQDLAGRLLAKGANLNAVDNEGRTAFDIARQYDRGAMMDFFLPFAVAGSKDDTGRTPLHLAVLYGRAKVTRQMLEDGGDPRMKDKDGRTPLHWAAMGNDAEIVRILLEFDAEINSVDNTGATPLHLAAQKNALKAAETLIARRANLNARDRTGRTPVHYAAEAEKLEMLDLLAARGTDMNQGDKNGVTALHHAVFSNKSGVVERLLARAADVNARDGNNLTPLHWAASMETPEMASLLLAFNANPNAHDKNGATPLHIAAFYNRAAIVEKLLARGALVNEKNADGQTPLALAVKNNALQTAALLRRSGGYQ